MGTECLPVVSQSEPEKVVQFLEVWHNEVLFRLQHFSKSRENTTATIATGSKRSFARSECRELKTTTSAQLFRSAFAAWIYLKPFILSLSIFVTFMSVIDIIWFQTKLLSLIRPIFRSYLGVQVIGSVATRIYVAGGGDGSCKSISVFSKIKSPEN